MERDCVLSVVFLAIYIYHYRLINTLGIKNEGSKYLQVCLLKFVAFIALLLPTPLFHLHLMQLPQLACIYCC